MPLKMKLDKNQTDQEILEQYAPQEIKAAVEKKLNVVHYASFNLVQKISAAAALLAIVIALPLLVKNVNYSKNSEIEKNGVIYKGKKSQKTKTSSVREADFFIYKNESSGPVLLKDNDFVEEGDELQIAYQTAEVLQAMILSVDGNGNVTQHFPQVMGKSQQMDISSSQKLLSQAYELDDAKSFERFIMITSKKSFTSDSFLNAVSMMTKEEAKTSEVNSYFPKNCKIKSIVLLK